MYYVDYLIVCFALFCLSRLVCCLLVVVDLCLLVGGWWLVAMSSCLCCWFCNLFGCWFWVLWLVCLYVALLIVGCLLDLIGLPVWCFVCGFGVDVLVAACYYVCGLERLLFGCLFWIGGFYLFWLIGVLHLLVYACLVYFVVSVQVLFACYFICGG